MSAHRALEAMTALVTGGTRGLGRVIAEGYAAAGAQVLIVGRKPDTTIGVAKEIERATGSAVTGIACHLGHWSELDQLVDEVYRESNRVDVLVNNAGMSPTYPSIVEITEELFDKTIGVNLKGPLRLSALVGSRMAEQGGGSIINVTSVAAIRPRPNYIVYAAAKAGLDAITAGLAQAFAPSVRVNSIMAGPFRTDIARDWDMSIVGPRLRTYPAGRAGDPSEILGAALYLASEQSSFTTGSVIRVDGGMAIT